MTTNKGTYVAVVLDENTIKTLQQFIKDHSIPNGLRPHELHATVIDSKKHCPDYESPGTYVAPLVGQPDELAIWEIGENEKANCLVLKFRCLALEKRHEELSKKHSITHIFDTYHPHITLSYDCGDLNIDELADIKEVITEIIIVEEYSK